MRTETKLLVVTLAASPVVTLSAAKGLSRVAHEMLRCAQHDHSSMTVLP